MVDQSEHLESFLKMVENIEKAYALQFKALAELYEKIMNGPEKEVKFTYMGGGSVPAWPPMPREKAVALAPVLLGMALIHGAVMLYGALDTYMFKMCGLNYDAEKLEDRSWFHWGMIEPILGIDHRECLKWPEIDKLRQIWEHFIHAYSTTNPMINDGELRNRFEDVRIFAIDFERALIIYNPKVRLK